MFAHDFPFDPTAGYSLEDLRVVKPPVEEPADFDVFWERTFDEAMQVPLRMEIKPDPSFSTRDHEVFEVAFDGMLTNRVGGWLVKPRFGQVVRGLVFGNGYSGIDAPQLDLCDPGTTAIFPCATGLRTRSLHPKISPEANDHVLYGIGSRETYIHRFNVMDYWRAASALIETIPEAGKRLNYIGESFGGGIGALMLPWDKRFQCAQLVVPSFGNHPLRLQIPCNGSGESVRLLAEKHPEIRKTLAYFDAAIAAKRIAIPMHIAAAEFDPAVPPAGQFSIYNALSCPKSLLVLKAGHFTHPDEVEERSKINAAWRQVFATHE